MIKEKKLFFGFSKIQLFQVVLLYSVAHIGIFFSLNGYFWDDYTLVGTPDFEILQLFREAGTFLNLTGWLHVNLLKFGPWVYKFLTFFLFLFSGLLLNTILIKYDKNYNEKYRLYFVIIFLLFPFYLVKPALIMMPYTVSLFLFFLAWSFIDRARLFALILFFLSFNVQSFLVFFLVPFLELYYRKFSDNLTIKTFIEFSLRHLFYILLPFVFFGIKIFYFRPFGNYSGYNENFSLINLFSAPYQMLISFFSTFYSYLAIIFIIVCVFYVFGINFKLPFIREQRKNLFLGFFLILLACFPYWIIGLAPTFYEWSSRHLLLVPLGVSLLVSAFIFSTHVRIRKYLFTVVVAISIFINLKTYIEFYLDWDKQNQLVLLFHNDSNIKNRNLFFITDNTINAIERKYRYYEWNGLFSRSFLDESRFGLDKNDYLVDNVYKYLNKENSDLSGFDSFFNLKHSKAKQFIENREVLPTQIQINYKKRVNGFPILPKYSITTHVD